MNYSIVHLQAKLQDLLLIYSLWTKLINRAISLQSALLKKSVIFGQLYFLISSPFISQMVLQWFKYVFIKMHVYNFI